MGIFDKLRKREESVETVVNEDTVSDNLLRALLNNEVIDRDKAMSLPAVSSAVDKISNTVAMLPINLYKEEITEDGKRKITPMSDDKRVSILNGDTGDTLDSFQLKKAMVQDYLLDRGGFAYIEKSMNEFKSIRYVDSINVSYVKNTDPIFKDFKYIVNGRHYEYYEFITILRNTKDGVTSRSLIAEVSKAIETSFETILFELGIVKKGGAKKGFLTSEKKLGQPEMDKLKESWKRLYSNNEENIMVLNQGLKFQESGATGVELQLNERKKTLKEEINGIFHISDDWDKYIKEAVMPILKAIETALNKNFLLEKEKGSYYFAFDTKEITKGDIKTRYEAYKIAIEKGWLTRNEVRYIEDFENIEGLDVISMNLADVLFDINTGKFYTPNTGQITQIDNAKEVSKDDERSGEE